MNRGREGLCVAGLGGRLKDLGGGKRLTVDTIAGLLGLAGLLVVGGCASPTAAVPRTTTPSPPPVNLATSLVTAQGTWAIADMGGSAADEENFWQLFVRPAGASSWRLATPEGVASNGGLIAAGSPTSVLAGFGISQGLAFSPLASSTDAGSNWAPGLIGPGDALDVDPDALSIGPAGHELALQTNGIVDQSTGAVDQGTSGGGQGTGGATWTKLTSVKALAASAAGKSCGLIGINAVSFTVGSVGSAAGGGTASDGTSGAGTSDAGTASGGTPLVAGSCTRPGVVGIFSNAGGEWQAAGPTLPAGYGGDPVQVIRLVSTATGNAALLRAEASLLVAWTTGSAARVTATSADWTTPVAVPAGTGSGGAAGSGSAAGTDVAAGLQASGFGPDGSAWVLLGGGRVEVIGGPGGSWQALPPVPTGTAVLVPPPPTATAGTADKAAAGKAAAGKAAAGEKGTDETATTGSAGTAGTEALAVAGKVLTVWRLDAGTWTKVQVINVPIPAGSSG